MAYYVVNCTIEGAEDLIGVEIKRNEMLYLAEQLLRAYNAGNDSTFLSLSGKVTKDPR